MRLHLLFDLLLSEHPARGVDTVPTARVNLMLLRLQGNQLSDGGLVQVWVSADFTHKLGDYFLVDVAGREEWGTLSC